MDVETTTDANPQHIGWAIHVFTSLGIVAGFFAVVSVLDRSPRAALLWLMTAMIIDGLDGPIARRYDVLEPDPEGRRQLARPDDRLRVLRGGAGAVHLRVPPAAAPGPHRADRRLPHPHVVALRDVEQGHP